MFIKTLKELAKHPSVKEIVRKRGDVVVVLAPEWMNFNGTAYVCGKNAAEVLLAFNGDEVCLRSDVARAPKEVVHTMRRRWHDEKKQPRDFLLKQRFALVGIMEGVGPSYRAVETLEESGKPAWDTADYSSNRFGCAWASIGGSPAEYGLTAADVAGIPERFESREAFKARVLGAATKPRQPEPHTVADLVAALLKMPQDARLRLSRDAEGNGFADLGSISKTASGRVVLWPVHDEQDEA